MGEAESPPGYEPGAPRGSPLLWILASMVAMSFTNAVLAFGFHTDFAPEAATTLGAVIGLGIWFEEVRHHG